MNDYRATPNAFGAAAKVERDLRARWRMSAAFDARFSSSAFGEDIAIVFRHGESSIGAVTDAKQRPGFPADPPMAELTILQFAAVARWRLPKPS